MGVCVYACMRKIRDRYGWRSTVQTDRGRKRDASLTEYKRTTKERSNERRKKEEMSALQSIDGDHLLPDRAVVHGRGAGFDRVSSVSLSVCLSLSYLCVSVCKWVCVSEFVNVYEHVGGKSDSWEMMYRWVCLVGRKWKGAHKPSLPFSLTQTSHYLT